MNNVSLEGLSAREIVLSLIFLKEGNPNFVISTIRDWLGNVPKEYELPVIFKAAFDKDYFFAWDYLFEGGFELPNYKLSKEGRKMVESQFINYPSNVHDRLKQIATKVWAN